MKYPIAVAEYAEVRDAAGVLVALCFSREQAQLIVDLANAAEVQLVTGIYAVQHSPGNWIGCNNAGAIVTTRMYQPTPHAAILAADKWLNDKKKGGVIRA